MRLFLQEQADHPVIPGQIVRDPVLAIGSNPFRVIDPT